MGWDSEYLRRLAVALSNPRDLKILRIQAESEIPHALLSVSRDYDSFIDPSGLVGFPKGFTG
jgi:hypothetical protein